MSKSDLDILRGLTEEHVHHMLPSKIYKRAEAYYRNQRVHNPRRIGTTLEAEVQGTELYAVHIETAGGVISSSCTCPFAEINICKHIGAVLLQWIYEPESFAVMESEEQLLRLEPLRAKPAVTETFPPQPSSPLGESPWWCERHEAISGGADASGESSLYSLLEHLPLAELREIARQRGWRIRGNSKADYVAALVPMLVDPTEVARAVTTLPDSLREALRAAFVAEGGGGITPTALAHTMTALRRGERQLVKPVEAAGLLLDLARWGLVIPWRDSPNGALRYLLPWEVQRHIPPLPGWCPQSIHAPLFQVMSRDRYSFVQLLYAIWEHISQEPPILRQTPKQSPERHPLTALQDWIYDPQEAKDWSIKGRGRTEPGMRTLSVPPMPFLLDDADLSALASLTNGDIEQLEFVCRLLHELDLVRIEREHLVPQPEVMVSFLRRPTTEQCMVVAAAYMSLLDWSELDMLLRADSRLVLQRNTHLFLPYSQFRSHLISLRHMLLRFLATAGEEGWCALADVEDALRQLWPHFSAAEIAGQPWLSQAWELTWRQDQRELSKDEDLGWGKAQGGFLRMMLEGPLHWLGFAELCRQDGQLIAFRLRGLADWVWDRPTIGAQERLPSKAVTVDEANGIIIVHPTAVPPEAHTLLGRIALLEKAAPSCFIYRLDMRATYSAFERGESLPDLLAMWEQVMPLPIPQAVHKTLTDWWLSYGQVRLYEGFALLELADDVTLSELEAITSLSQHIIARISPRLVLVPDEVVEALSSEFAAKGYTPKEAK